MAYRNKRLNHDYGHNRRNAVDREQGLARRESAAERSGNERHKDNADRDERERVRNQLHERRRDESRDAYRSRNRGDSRFETRSSRHSDNPRPKFRGRDDGFVAVMAIGRAHLNHALARNARPGNQTMAIALPPARRKGVRRSAATLAANNLNAARHAEGQMRTLPTVGWRAAVIHHRRHVNRDVPAMSLTIPSKQSADDPNVTTATGEGSATATPSIKKPA